MKKLPKKLPLTQGLYAIVDYDDFEFLSQFKWHALKLDGGYRAATRRNKKTLYLHRFLMGEPNGIMVDHIDGDPLNNQRNNLRLCSQAENQRNCKKHKDNKSGFKGVHYANDRSLKKWVSQISFNKKVIVLGRFNNPEDAARAYDIGAKKYHKEFAYLNNI